LRETILNLAVSGKLVPQEEAVESGRQLLRRLRAGDVRQASKSSIVKKGTMPIEPRRSTFRLPPNWDATSLGDVCKLVTSGSRGWAEFYSDVGAKFVRAQNIRFGRLRLDELAYVKPPQSTEGSRTRLLKGDLLIVITGAGVPNPAMLDQELGEAYISQHVALVRPTTIELSRWLLTCLMAPLGGRTDLVDRAYGAGKPGLSGPSHAHSRGL
jgi:type I restriction enzyme S subunit